MLWLMLYWIPLILYCIILFGFIIIHPAGGIVAGIISAFAMVPWLLFARWICKKYDESKRFNHRK
ncbi:MAG: hypothetical protein SOX32_12825 [Candidatus Choladocola sp.]|nr:hypothetical protein [Candidatus Choladocola sp.]